MARTEQVAINPELLIWARTGSGFSIEAAADKVGIALEKLEAAEKGETLLSFAQLKNVAAAYKTPLALFFLAEAPPVPPEARDFRLNPDHAHEALPPEVHMELRRARQRRDEALELSREMRQVVRRFEHAATSQVSEVLGKQISQLVKPGLAERRWSNADEALKARKRSVESLGVLVFETTRISTDAMRGASLWFDRMPVIVLNGADSPAGRSFTLFHELAHLLLRNVGVCDLAPTRTKSTAAALETKCNEAAAAALMPKLEVEELLRARNEWTWTLEELGELADVFRTSKEAMLVRLVSLKHAPSSKYWSMRERFREDYRKFKDAQKKPDSSGGPSPAVMAVRNLGRPFVRLVLSAFDEDRIDLSTASDYLGVKVKHLQRIRELSGRTS